MKKSEETEILVAIGQRIKNERIKKGIKQVELARICQMEKASISRIEAGKINVTVKTLNIVATALKVEFLDLFKHGAEI